jgi:hypothetical protein
MGETVVNQDHSPKRARRRLRGVRAKEHRPLLLTQRDRTILTLAGLTRFISTDQLARELFPSIERCRRRIRQLFDRGLITITLAGSRAPNLISLSRRGLAELALLDPATAHHLRLPGPIRLSAVPHHLAIVDTRLYAAALSRKFGLTFDRWSGASTARSRELNLGSLHPDAIAEFTKLDGSTLTIAIEVDCGTETTEVLEGKIDRYAELDDTEVGELWFVVAAGRGRVRTIERLLAAKDLAITTRVISREHVLTRPALNPPRALQAQDSHADQSASPNSVTP